MAYRQAFPAPGGTLYTARILKRSDPACTSNDTVSGFDNEVIFGAAQLVERLRPYVYSEKAIDYEPSQSREFDEEPTKLIPQPTRHALEKRRLVARQFVNDGEMIERWDFPLNHVFPVHAEQLVLP